MADSPGSPLSSHASSEFGEDVKLEDVDHMAPSKRQKLGANSYQSTPFYDAQQEDQGFISDDSEASAPSIQNMAPGLTDDEHVEQVTVCKWRNCSAGDLGDMDKLVEHINEDHIGQRQKKYICEWEGCLRMDANHASGYALRAHMRSHTREKPFYCALPECDRSFTRSDALAKHMRTVHETEALRPSDPIPRNHSQAQIKVQRLKLTMKPRQSNGDAATASAAAEDAQPSDDHDSMEIPVEYQPTEEELALPIDEQYRLLRKQLYWAGLDATQLKEENSLLEEKRKEEWRNNMLVLANVVEAELATVFDPEKTEQDEYDQILRAKEEFLPSDALPMPEVVWYRKVEEPAAGAMEE